MWLLPSVERDRELSRELDLAVRIPGHSLGVVLTLPIEAASGVLEAANFVAQHACVHRKSGTRHEARQRALCGPL